MLGAGVTVGREVVVAARVATGRDPDGVAAFAAVSRAGTAGTRLPWRVSGVPLTRDMRDPPSMNLRVGAQE